MNRGGGCTHSNIFKSIVGEIFGPDVRKLTNILEKLTIDNLIFKVENEDLRRAVFMKKKRRKHDKSLFNILREGSDIKVIFFSSIKI